MAAAVPTRARVLKLYRDILKTAKTWPVPKEQVYIQKEARKLFRRNKNLTNPEEINEKLFEAESRLALGIHYQNPYPRMYHAPKITPRQLQDDIKNKNQRSTAAYMRSLY